MWWERGGEPVAVLDELRREIGYGRGVTVRQHWWNGTFGTLFRIDLWLQEDAGQWSIRVRWSTYPEQTRHYRSEDDARRQLALWMTENGPWKRVDAQGANDGRQV